MKIISLYFIIVLVAALFWGYRKADVEERAALKEKVLKPGLYALSFAGAFVFLLLMVSSQPIKLM